MTTAAPTPPLRTEIVAGITTFFTMAYIVVVNPAILATEGTGLSFAGVMTATVVLSAAMTLLMGLYAKLPYAVAPGMGINAFFTFGLVLGKKICARHRVLGGRVLRARLRHRHSRRDRAGDSEEHSHRDRDRNRHLPHVSRAERGRDRRR